MFGALDMPTRQSFVSEMVGLDDLPNAVGLNSATFNLTRIGGPALGAVVIEVANVGDCFAINALSYLAVIAALLAMRPSELFAGRRAPHARGQVREGLRYIRRTPRLRQTLLLLAVVGTLSFNFNTVLPVLAKTDFRGDAATYAFMLVAMGVGSVAGALMAARNRAPRLRVVVGAALSMGVVMLAVAWEHELAIEIALLAGVGFFSLLYLSTSNSTCQLSSAPEMRGRVMGVYSVIFTGSTPVGALLIGLVDQEMGVLGLCRRCCSRPGRRRHPGRGAGSPARYGAHLAPVGPRPAPGRRRAGRGGLARGRPWAAVALRWWRSAELTVIPP